jgi:hypothetical protein
MIVPRSPAKITVSSTDFMSISPFPIVLATAVPNTRNDIKLKLAAQMTACFGDKTLVDTMVAIEFAASWKPLVKSKINAIRIISNINKVYAVAGSIV